MEMKDIRKEIVMLEERRYILRFLTYHNVVSS